MRTAAFIALAAAELVAGHATFQMISKNGGEQSDTGVRGTSNGNNPILSTAENLASDMMICKGGAAVDGQFEVAGGDKLSLQWHHNKGPATGDADEPIAESHRGPIMVYVTPAETNGESGWVKIHEEGLSGGKWAVDNFRTNGGTIDVTLPDLPAGDYLLRSEIIALHEGNRAGGAQFYNGCGQITVTSSGSAALGEGVDLRTVYKTDDPSVLFDIYGGATSYEIPGPKLLSGGGDAAPAPAPAPSNEPTTPSSTSVVAPSATATAAPTNAPATTTAAAPTTLITSAKPAVPSGGGDASVTVKKYYQCGGKGHTGGTQCEAGLECKVQNDYYSQCL